MRSRTGAARRWLRPPSRKGTVLLTMSVVASAAAVGTARRQVGATLAGNFGPETVYSCRLVVSELVTNAIRFTAPGEMVELTISEVGGRLLIEVADSHPQPPGEECVGEEDENGRGLMICRALACGDGWRQRPGGGKIVWVQLAAPGVSR